MQRSNHECIAHRFVVSALLLTGLLVGVTRAPEAWADERAFTFVYESTTSPKGTFEYEHWITWKKDKRSDAAFDRFDFRHEFEFGITDNWQLGFYVSDWRSQDGRSVKDGAEWRNVAVESIYSLSDPTADLLGVALYGEMKYGDQLIELEGKLILQKNIRPFIFAYNATFEAEWEGSHYGNDNGKFEETFGASYQISPRWLIGTELLHEIEYEDFREFKDSVLYLGPTVSFRTKRWWMSLTPLFQVTDIGSRADYQARVIFGINF